MMRIFTAILMLAALAACGGNQTTEATAETATPPTIPDAIVAHPDYDPGLALVVDNDCYNCHKVDEKLVGPPYKEVAKKYAGQADVIDVLANKIMTGGTGVWGDSVAMTPHPTVTQEDAVKIVKYIMLLKDL
ncbi:MAG: c-type cytochrome [Saprospiraceae bacterium]